MCVVNGNYDKQEDRQLSSMLVEEEFSYLWKKNDLRQIVLNVV